MTDAPLPDDADAPTPSPAATSTAARAGAALGRAASSALVGGRAAIRKNQTANKAYRTGVGVVGGTTVALGVVMMPLPGPGSLIALGGLGILGTEFEGVKKVNEKATRVVKKAAGAAKDALARRRANQAAQRASADSPTTA
jgi:uncharacterized protein (TIGR02611 family)